MSGRILTRRALNRALLARQLLLERAALPVERAAERIGGAQAQYAPSIYVGLWSRVRDLRREDVTRALERGRLVQGTLLRATIHAVSARDYPLFAAGVRRPRLEWWLRVNRIADRDLDALDARVRAAPRRSAGARARAGAPLVEDGFPPAAARSAGLAVDILRVPPSGTWERRRADLLGLWRGAEASEEEGLAHLLRRYLGAFGPAPLADAAQWAGVDGASLGAVSERLQLRRLRDGEGRELLDLPRALLPDPGTPAPVRFLPTWDATLLVHARRTGILPEEYRPLMSPAPSRGRGGTTEGGSSPSRSRRSHAPPAPSWPRKRRGSPPSTRRLAPCCREAQASS